MLRHWREREFSRQVSPPMQRRGLRAWQWLNRSPKLYGWLMRLAAAGLKRFARPAADGRRWIKRLPLVGAAWSQCRDLEVPSGSTFQTRWKQGER
jgi:L-lactate dehydrogenase complex protein LldF